MLITLTCSDTSTDAEKGSISTFQGDRKIHSSSQVEKAVVYEEEINALREEDKP